MTKRPQPIIAYQHKAIYENLMELCAEKDSAFYYKDFKLDDLIYRIFNYRLASYTDFCKSNALEARGIMFELYEDGAPKRLACRPPKKFFNLGENPFTLSLDCEQIQEAMYKEDGSLVSTFIHNNQLGLKTKGSIASDQVKASYKLLEHKDWKQLKDLLWQWTFLGWTVNMEYVAPDNRIVLPYDKPELYVLNLVCNRDGQVIYRDDKLLSNNALSSYFVPSMPIVVLKNTHKTLTKFVEEIKNMTDFEGYVLRFPNQLVKCKTNWYLSLHHTKDSITIPRRLFECVINEGTDDLRAMFSSDTQAVKIIEDMENKVLPEYRRIIKTVNEFCVSNNHLSRKEFALKAQQEIALYFSLGMSGYLYDKGLYSAPMNFKEWALRNYKMFGIADVEEKVEE